MLEALEQKLWHLGDGAGVDWGFHERFSVGAGCVDTFGVGVWSSVHLKELGFEVSVLLGSCG